ncbi:thymidine kinase, cytosolic-like [Liolophura sinensis]|uniref:thymidine kinase, cytosolic-like n=1 Tax=Liolophura sinensis TaxID=3198878 RepID=UPI0031586C60
MMSTAHVTTSPCKCEKKPKGQIQIIFGPMFSGKTTELVRRMKRYQLANYKCLVVKYSKDDRYDIDGVATHEGQVLPAVSAMSLMDLCCAAGCHDVIGIDEGQFFPDVVEFCDIMAEMGKTVIVAALDGTFQKKGFGNILNLVPLAESVVKLNAVCMKCFSAASFTKRKGSEKEVEVIGGADKYLAVCRTCFYSPQKSEEDKENTPVQCDLHAPVDTKHKRKLFTSPLNMVNAAS